MKKHSSGSSWNRELALMGLIMHSLIYYNFKKWPSCFGFCKLGWNISLDTILIG